jgi:hypothetical protein
MRVPNPARVILHSLIDEILMPEAKEIVSAGMWQHERMLVAQGSGRTTWRKA